MAPKWIGFLIFIFIMAALVGSVSEGVALAGDAERTSVITNITSYATYYSEQDWGRLITPATHFNFFGSILKLLTLDFPLFEGQFEVVKLVVWAPIVGTVVFGLVLVFFSILRRDV